MRKHGKKILGFVGIASALVLLVVFTLMLLADDTLKRARQNCDTISITATYNHQLKTLTATQNIAYKNRTGQNLNEIKFHTYANAYRDGAKNPPVVGADDISKAYPNGKSFGGITIHNLHVSNLCKDNDCSKHHGDKVIPIIDGDDDTVMIAKLDKPLAPNKTTYIKMEYTVKLANIKHRLGWTDDAVNLANFYPVPCIFEGGKWLTYPYSANGDPFFNALHNFDVKLTAPKEMVVASSGTLISQTATKTHVRSTSIRDFAAVLSSKFKTMSQTVGKTTVQYYYLDDDAPHKSLETAVQSLNTFSSLFTKYPYQQLSVVQTDFLHGGMEYGELVYVSRDMLPDRESHNYVIVHEIAHQWWYGIVGNNQWRTAWIDEGLAEYSTMLFFDKNPQYNIKRENIINNARANLSAYVKLVQGVGEQVDTSMNRALDDFNTSYEYVYMTYVRGLLLFVDLESILTRDTLLGALRDFSYCAKFSIATQHKLINCIEKTTGQKVRLFFETYTLGWVGFN